MTIRETSTRQLFVACAELAQDAVRELSAPPDSQQLKIAFDRVQRLTHELLALEAGTGDAARSDGAQS